MMKENLCVMQFHRCLVCCGIANDVGVRERNVGGGCPITRLLTTTSSKWDTGLGGQAVGLCDDFHCSIGLVQGRQEVSLNNQSS